MSLRALAVVLAFAALAACSRSKPAAEEEPGGRPLAIYASPTSEQMPSTAPSGSANGDAGGETLQEWMNAHVTPPTIRSDLASLASALDRVATFAPPGYPNWASISRDGAEAARSGDLDAAKASCRACHDQYRTKYKAELRGRRI